MKKIIAVAVIGFVLSSCRQTPYYKVEIHYYPFSKQDKRTIELIKLNSKDDTAAFEESVRTYWMYKLLSEGYNDNKEADYPLGNVPYFFFTYKYIGADSSAVDFDSSIATKLAKPIIEDVRKTVIEILKKEKQEKLKMDSSKHGPADIY